MTGCLIDLDGVLTDFVGACCKVHHMEDPYKDGENAGEFDLAKLFDMSDTEFWHPLNKQSFWVNMKKTKEADQIVDIVEKKFGKENCAILTSPSDSELSIVGKINWVKDHYPQFKRRIIVAACKSFMARDNILIDDKDENVEEFDKYGGGGILLPRMWNKFHYYHNDPLSILKEQLDSIKVVKK